MTDQEKQHLKALIVATSMYYGHEIPDPVLNLYVEDLEDLPFAAVAGAIKEVRRDPKTTRFPLPAVIRERLEPAQDLESQALLAVGRIIEAVARFGWTNSERAREVIGELGWQVVEREGGWQNLCGELNQDNIGMLRAQWRQTAIAVGKASQAGTLSDAPALPKPRSESSGLQRLTFDGGPK